MYIVFLFKLHSSILNYDDNRFDHFFAEQWSFLNNVAEQEGNSVGEYDQKTLDQCKSLCDDNDRCNSLAFRGGVCHLKDKCIDASEPQRIVFGYRTYYKNCNGTIRNF